MKFPEICLAIDNCFASKRFTEPLEWMKVAADLGVFYVEASADNECDPLYQGTDYLKRWVGKVQEASAKTGVKVCNLYSGHGTYSTLGLAHTDPDVRARILNNWLKPMVRTAGELDAGIGFFCHAFANQVLQDRTMYQEYYDELVRNLADLATYAKEVGCLSVGLEQMYTPHQVPWTIQGAQSLIRSVSATAKHPFYITIDTGHASGQRKFLKPEREAVKELLNSMEKGLPGSLWLGCDRAYELLDNYLGSNKGNPEDLVDQIMELAGEYPWLFAESRDGSPYAWLEELACHSPIIHLQQTDGTVSSHWPFTPSKNQMGIIEGAKVLEAIKKSFSNPDNPSLPKVDRIYLTIEMFSSTGSINYYTLRDLKETVRYWRQFIPAP